jgi:hypothetical protein
MQRKVLLGGRTSKRVSAVKASLTLVLACVAAEKNTTAEKNTSGDSYPSPYRQSEAISRLLR